MKPFTKWISLYIVLAFSVVEGVNAEEESEEAAPVKAQYVELKPAFVTNFGTSSKKLKYVKAEISLRVPSSQAADAIEMHKALVRHEIVMLLSAQAENVMTAPGGQETVRQAVLSAVQAVIEEETGAQQIDDLLFTSFVLQR